MSVTVGRRKVNPRLGTYFGIFAAAFSALVLLVLVFEQLGVSEQLLRAVMLLVPVAMFVVVGVMSRSGDVLEYFAVGRRVPAVYAGTSMALAALGGTGLVAMTGLFFIHGIDAWCVGTGVVAGFVLMGVLIAPYLRKFGGFTLPSYLGRRFDSRILRLAAAAFLAVPLLLVLAAEIVMAVGVAERLSGLARPVVLAVIVAGLVLSLVLGGLRSATWTATAQGIAVALATLVPSGIIAVLAGNLPLPQLSHGATLRALDVIERGQELRAPPAPPLSFMLAGVEPVVIAQRFVAPFGSVGPLAYIVATLTVMAGIAVAPWLIGRIGTTPGVYEARKSAGWATVTTGILMLTVSALAVFMRDMHVEQLAMHDASNLPAWFAELRTEGLARIAVEGPRLTLQSIAYLRDGVLFALPIASRFPEAVLYLTLAGAFAATLLGAGASTTALAHLVAEDVIQGTAVDPLPDRLRLSVARLAVCAVPVAGAMIAMTTRADPFRLVLWAITISAATAFPVVGLSIWWKRLDERGALAAMVMGFATSVLAIFAAEATGLLDGLIAGSIGVPAALLTALLVSGWQSSTGRPELELVAEIRVPGGETFYDRELRRLRQKQRQAR